MKHIITKADIDDTWLTNAKGIWRQCGTDSGKTASLSCPGCGEVASLSNHKIDDQGIVTPSLVCPFDGCSFHEWVQLEGWNPDGLLE